MEKKKYWVGSLQGRRDQGGDFLEEGSGQNDGRCPEEKRGVGEEKIILGDESLGEDRGEIHHYQKKRLKVYITIHPWGKQGRRTQLKDPMGKGWGNHKELQGSKERKTENKEGESCNIHEE